MPNVQPKWTIEPVVQYIVYYYSNNETGTIPLVSNNVLQTKEQAEQVAKDYILNNNNTGVCVISQMAGYIVYPATYFEDF